MEDLFEREQGILDHALLRLEKIKDGGICSADEYEVIVKEYRRLLKQLRRITKISDKTTVDLNTSKLDLLDKVHYDELTGIYNRRFLEENARQTLHSLISSGGVLSVLMIDVDFFKRYNDTYGHSAGDDCLRMVAKTLTKSLMRTGDFVARYGGEEFVVFLQDVDEQGACAVGERILSNIRACAICHEKNDAADCVTVSVGITTAEANATLTIEDYINAADRALYLSKENGRNRSTFIKLGGIKNDV